MTTNRTMLMTLSALVIGGTMLMGAGSAMADRPNDRAPGRSDDHARYSQRDNDRGHSNDHRDYDRGRDNDRSGVRVGVGVTWSNAAPVYTPVYTSTTQVWVPDAYVTQTQNVLVVPAHWETVTVPAVTETRYPSNGRPYTVVIAPARVQRVWVADRYEARNVQVLVPGHWETMVTPGSCPAPVIVERQPSTTISIGGIFRF